YHEADGPRGVQRPTVRRKDHPSSCRGSASLRVAVNAADILLATVIYSGTWPSAWWISTRRPSPPRGPSWARGPSRTRGTRGSGAPPRRETVALPRLSRRSRKYGCGTAAQRGADPSGRYQRPDAAAPGERPHEARASRRCRTGRPRWYLGPRGRVLRP